MSHVRLVMIARDEQDKLATLAESVRGLIDSWCIVVDRRTRDNTFDRAPEAFDYVPGECHWSELTAETFDFAAARNEAQQLASEPGVYLLWLDPDTPPVGKFPDELTAPVYTCDVRDEKGWSWQCPVLVRSDAAGRWRLPAHESMEITAPLGTWKHLPDVYLQRSGSGTNPARIAWSIDVLRKAADNCDIDSPRALFYLGQMLVADDRYEEALEAFIRRVGVGGDPEERFFAFVRIAEVLLQPGMEDLPKASRALLDAYGMRPDRSEPLFYLAHIANLLGNHEMAMAFANQGLMNPPSRDRQFVMRWVEEWGMRLQWAAAAHHLGNPKAPEVTNELLERDDLHDNWRGVLECYRELIDA